MKVSTHHQSPRTPVPSLGSTQLRSRRCRCRRWPLTRISWRSRPPSPPHPYQPRRPTPRVGPPSSLRRPPGPSAQCGRHARHRISRRRPSSAERSAHPPEWLPPLSMDRTEPPRRSATALGSRYIVGDGRFPEAHPQLRASRQGLEPSSCSCGIPASLCRVVIIITLGRHASLIPATVHIKCSSQIRFRAYDWFRERKEQKG